MFNIRKTDLARYNSMTKYPSIPTYHKMGEKGILTEEVQVQFSGDVIVTEKIDGTNARIIVGPDGSVIVGSREELLWHVGDLIHNPSMGIVDAVREFAESMNDPIIRDSVVVCHGEVYGKGIGAASRQYTSLGAVGFRLFDVAFISDHQNVLSMPLEQISAWIENGGQRWFDAIDCTDAVNAFGMSKAPILYSGPSDVIPTSTTETRNWLFDIRKDTACHLDADGHGNPEGVVIRTFNRSAIAKLRREDYARSFRQPQTR